MTKSDSDCYAYRVKFPVVLIIYGDVTNHLKTQWLKTTVLSDSQFCVPGNQERLCRLVHLHVASLGLPHSRDWVLSGVESE